MSDLSRFATSTLADATAHVIAPSRTVEHAEVQYCVSSGYVRITAPGAGTLITHISNVVLETS